MILKFNLKKKFLKSGNKFLFQKQFRLLTDSTATTYEVI